MARLVGLYPEKPNIVIRVVTYSGVRGVAARGVVGRRRFATCSASCSAIRSRAPPSSMRYAAPAPTLQ